MLPILLQSSSQQAVAYLSSTSAHLHGGLRHTAHRFHVGPLKKAEVRIGCRPLRSRLHTRWSVARQKQLVDSHRKAIAFTHVLPAGCL